MTHIGPHRSGAAMPMDIDERRCSITDHEFDADEEEQHSRVVELRAARTGTIVERIWQGSVNERLDWASEHGRFDAPDLEPATGKNLYH